MEHPAKGADDTTDVVPQRLEVLYPEFLAAVLDGIREDTERMAKHRSELTFACKTARKKVFCLLKDWTSVQLAPEELSKIEESQALFESANKTVFLSEQLSLFNKALMAIEETRRLYSARIEEEARRKAEEEEARRKAEEEEARRKAEEEEARRKAEEERIRRHEERMSSRITYCLLGLTAVIVLLAIFTHWTASVLGLFASFLWPLFVRKHRVPALLLGIAGYLAIPAPFIPLILRHPYLAGIPVGIAMIVWFFFSRAVADDQDWGREDIDEDISNVKYGDVWAVLVRLLPQFAKWCDWSKLEGVDWAFLLGSRPQFADKCDWARLDGGDWASLLCDQPQFADKCPWEELDGIAWASLLEEQPQFADKCGKWAEFDGSGWAVLLRSQPQFADKCDWSKLNDDNWTWLLEKEPQFAEKRNK